MSLTVGIHDEDHTVWKSKTCKSRTVTASFDSVAGANLISSLTACPEESNAQIQSRQQSST